MITINNTNIPSLSTILYSLLSARLQTASRQYGVAILISQTVYDLMSDEGKEYCRRVDKVSYSAYPERKMRMNIQPGKASVVPWKKQ